ncbi:MAG: hypothetical protein M3460_11910 [Actinomycetota bacterium]|nr:hypothetical protein [Actinomycetota bacterium]
MTATVEPLVRPGLKRSHQDDIAWAAVMRKARQAWPDSKLNNLLDRTVDDIFRTVGTKPAAFVWNGSKECLVLAYVAWFTGIERSVLTITDDLEFRGTCGGSPTGCPTV